MRPPLSVRSACSLELRDRLRWAMVWIFATAALGSATGAEGPAVRGVPFSRSYSLEDIGHVPRGSRLGFDRFGRLAVINETSYTVLNDSTWLDLAEDSGPERVPIADVVQAVDGRTYYGARGSWGYAEFGSGGHLHPIPLVPSNPPAWVATAAFLNVLPSQEGVFFFSWNGIVYWDFRKRKNVMLEVPRISHAFAVGNRVYVSVFEKPLQYIDLESESLKSVAVTSLADSIVETSARLDDSHSLIALVDGRLLAFDGTTVSPWITHDDIRIKGHVAVLQQLVDGRIAIAVTGQGLLLFSREGHLLMSLTTSQYHNITGLANREPGVLWAETEDSIEKILYNSPLSAFGQRLGLPIAWPIITSWNDQVYVASAGKLYRAEPGSNAEPTRFEPCANQPAGGAWALAAYGKRMLVGNGNALYAGGPDGSYQPIRSVRSLVQLVMYDENHCYAIGREEIAFFEWQNGRWEEPVQRIFGVSNPAVVHQIGRSVWMEMGGAGVAHLWISHGEMRLEVIRNETWTKGSWVNIGSIDDVVVLSARIDEPRRYFDERTGQWCAAPALERLLNRSPYWIARVEKDQDGVIWACHNEGLVRFVPKDGDYQIDMTSFDLANDRYPVLRILPRNEIWVSSARALYHLEKNWIASPARPPRPVLVSLMDMQRNEELLGAGKPEVPAWKFAFAQNNLSFRFYSGTDAWRRAPVYEYRFNDTDPWTAIDGSLLTFRGVREGIYRLQVRVAGMLAPAESTSTIGFAILPPWYRTWPAYALLGAGLMVIILGVARWTNYLERRRNRMLERVVDERTRLLTTTMAKLGEETRKAATLEERDRLANEIHDSVQQGLTGAILQLDTTLKIPTIGGDIRSRLNVVRKMVSYSRQEVQHAVWDMESPLLEGTNLADALRNLTTFVDSSGIAVDVTVSGDPISLGRATNHNLLRIAQEAANNAFRHANAKRIAIRLTYGSESVTLEINDDGAGFRPSEVLEVRVGHLGLRGIKTRAKKLRGQLSIESEPGNGTRIRVVVPVTVDQESFKHADLRAHEQNPHPAR